MRNFLTLSIFFFVLSVNEANAASFNCAAATRVIDIAICASTKVSALDSNMANIYRDALQRASDKDSFRREGRSWIQNVRDNCADEQCLIEAYENRIFTLTQTANDSAANEPSLNQNPRSRRSNYSARGGVTDTGRGPNRRYRYSDDPIFGIGDGFEICEALPHGIPTELWKNRGELKITQEVGLAGRMRKLTGTYTDGSQITYQFFEREDDCQAIARGEDIDKTPEITAADEKLATRRPKAASAEVFGIYKGQSEGIEIGIETRLQGTMFIVVNHSSTAISVDPAALKIVTSQYTERPCTLHLLSLMGIGAPLLAQKVAPGKKEGYMLGACVNRSSGTPLNGLVVVDDVVQRIEIGRLMIPVKRIR